MFNGHVKIGNGLRLNALCGIHHQQCTLASGNASRHLIRKLDMPRGVDEIENLFLSLMRIFHLDGMTLDGDATFFFQIHIIEHLSARHLDSFGVFQEAICQGGLTVIDVRNDAKVSDMLHEREIF